MELNTLTFSLDSKRWYREFIGVLCDQKAIGLMHIILFIEILYEIQLALPTRKVMHNITLSGH